jgi:hypothetical protein
MLQLLAADVAENGAAVIAQVRKEKPSVWLQCVCSLLPKQLQTEKLSPFSDLSDEEITLLERFLSSSRARDVTEVNGSAIAVKPDKPVHRNRLRKPACSLMLQHAIS